MQSCRRCHKVQPFGHIELKADIIAVDTDGNEIVIVPAGFYCQDGCCLQSLLQAHPVPGPSIPPKEVDS